MKSILYKQSSFHKTVQLFDYSTTRLFNYLTSLKVFWIVEQSYGIVLDQYGIVVLENLVLSNEGCLYNVNFTL